MKAIPTSHFKSLPSFLHRNPYNKQICLHHFELFHRQSIVIYLNSLLFFQLQATPRASLLQDHQQFSHPSPFVLPFRQAYISPHDLFQTAKHIHLCLVVISKMLTSFILPYSETAKVIFFSAGSMSATIIKACKNHRSTSLAVLTPNHFHKVGFSFEIQTSYDSVFFIKSPIATNIITHTISTNHSVLLPSIFAPQSQQYAVFFLGCSNPQTEHFKTLIPHKSVTSIQYPCFTSATSSVEKSSISFSTCCTSYSLSPHFINSYSI